MDIPHVGATTTTHAHTPGTDSIVNVPESITTLATSTRHTTVADDALVSGSHRCSQSLEAYLGTAPPQTTPLGTKDPATVLRQQRHVA